MLITLNNGDFSYCNPIEEPPLQPCALDNCNKRSSGHEHNPKDIEATPPQIYENNNHF